MARWLVELVGEKTDVEEFPYWFPEGPVHAIEAEGAYYLVGPAFENFNDHGEVWHAARSALDEFTGIASLLWPALQKPERGRIYREKDDGSRDTIVNIGLAHIRGRAKMRLTASSSSGEPTLGARLLEAARAHPQLHTSVLLWPLDPGHGLDYTES